MSLKHRTIYCNEEDVAVKLPLSTALQQFHEKGEFPLLEDPVVTQRTAIIGMFVLRPGSKKPLVGEISDAATPNQLSPNIYDESCDWVYNLDGIDGGWIIANLNSVDAYRLGLQYALSDAVMVGSNTVCAEGVSTARKVGYVWQPYGPFSWPSVVKHDPNLLAKANEQRKEWQQLGYLSSHRTYPAQIIVTNSGLKHDNSPDFLAAHVFKALHPNGEPLEVYILTTQIGAKRIIKRSQNFGLEDRIEKMLIVLPSLPDQPERMDLSTLPSLLLKTYDMKIVNHDGGQKVLLDFARQKVLTQMNITLGRNLTLKEVLEQLPDGIVSESTRMQCLEEIDERVHYFFSSRNTDGVSVRGIPKDLPISYCIEDEVKDVAILTFNTNRGFDFFRV